MYFYLDEGFIDIDFKRRKYLFQNISSSSYKFDPMFKHSILSSKYSIYS